MDVQGMQQWLDKVMAWGQADNPNHQRDICLHLSRLRDFLQKLLTYINRMSSTTEVMKNLPLLGQFLGRAFWIPCITADAGSRALLFQCLWGMYSESPKNAVEEKANQWIRKLLCQLTTDEDDTEPALLKHLGVPPTDYHLKVLKNRLAVLQENVGKSCSLSCDMNQRCLCDSIRATSEVCIPLVTRPEAASLMEALLQRPSTSVKAGLSEDFLSAISSAYSCQRLSLEEQAVVSLWYHNLSSLEEAVLSLLESVLANKKSTPQNLEQQIAESLLPKACAQHCSIFLVVNDILRCSLKQMEENESVKCLIQIFTSCFHRELELQKSQTCVPLKAFFPQSPQCLLVPLLIQPSAMPEDAWRRHLNWLSGSLQKLTEEEEEDRDSFSRGLHLVFEVWLLLVACAHWVEVAAQLLVTSKDSDCGPLLWLLTFYHHPTNRGHHRDQQLVRAKEVWSHLHCLFSAAGHPPSVERLQILAALLSPQPQQPSPAPLLILRLLVSFAVFSQLPLSGSTEILNMVVDQSGRADEAACVLSSLELRLNGGGCSSGDTNRVLLRIKALNAQVHISQVHSGHSVFSRLCDK